jgi:hypothetical protein
MVTFLLIQLILLRKALVIVLLLVGILGMTGGQIIGQVAALPAYGQPQIIASGQGFPVDIAVDKAGIVYWANQHPFGSGTLEKLTPGSSSPTTLLTGLQYVQGIGVDGAGDVYYDEYTAGILYKLPAGSSTPQVLASGLNYPNFMSVDAAGNVYFIAGQTCGNSIQEYKTSTKTVSTILTAPVLDGVFIAPSGDLYFVTCTNQQIERLSKGSSTPHVIFTWTGSSKPEGIAVDGSNIYFTIYGQSVNLLPAGSSTPIVLASVPTFTDAYAHQMALDSHGDVFFIDSYRGNIWEIPVVQHQITFTGPVLTSGPKSVLAGKTGTWTTQYNLTAYAPITSAQVTGITAMLSISNVCVDATCSGPVSSNTTLNLAGTSVQVSILNARYENQFNWTVGGMNADTSHIVAITLQGFFTVAGTIDLVGLWRASSTSLFGTSTTSPTKYLTVNVNFP